ncbi:macromolecule metabolism; macromolecule degradation; degradation of proteins, peptides, glycopeptides [hydrothermal vent metagenome]|uniref:Macromolecule metabolism macromolecule degradation degradation of proteins, peptides, glycopeptides n=1 Tax=hydrothermal vent metagenome TaxID=652676 RepID=A0A3B0RDN4_9ZZZZ
MTSINNQTDAVPVARALRKSRTRWRILAFVALGLALVALAARLAEGFQPAKDYIALVVIEGIITTDAHRMAVLEELAEDEQVRAVIVRINSPGGSTAGGEELYEALTKLRVEKPVVAVINELGASAAYMSAIATDRIFARRLSIVGSIGVLFSHVDASGLLNTIGIDLDKVASGPLKAEPDSDEPLEGEVRASLQALVDDSYNWFVDIVSERRGLSRPDTLELADGRIVNGRVALEAGLIDEFGGEAEAIAWLEGQEVEEDLPVLRTFPRPISDWERLNNIIGGDIASLLGLDLGGIDAVTLDGLVSVWHVGI